MLLASHFDVKFVLGVPVAGVPGEGREYANDPCDVRNVGLGLCEGADQYIYIAGPMLNIDINGYISIYIFRFSAHGRTDGK